MAVEVSIILPVYNRAEKLGHSIKSVLSQSYTDFELIVVDDASTEDIKTVVESMNDSRLKYIRLSVNGGASVARNAGLAAATGNFIAFQDSDDLWLPWKLDLQMKMLEEMPEFGVVTGSKILYGRGDGSSSYGSGLVSIRPPPRTRLRSGEDQVRKFLVENRISLQNALFRRDCYPEPIWFDASTRSNADWAFTSSLCQHTQIFESPEPVVLAFSSPDGISKNSHQKTIGLIRIVKRNREVLKCYPKDYAWNFWRIGRMLMRSGKHKYGRRFCLEALYRDPTIPARVLREKLGQR